MSLLTRGMSGSGSEWPGRTSKRRGGSIRSSTASKDSCARSDAHYHAPMDIRGNVTCELDHVEWVIWRDSFQNNPRLKHFL